MKHVRILGLAVLAVMAAMAFVGAGTASATTIDCAGVHCPVGTVIDASLTGSASLTTTEGTVLDTCTGGTVKGKTTTTGSASETVKGNIEELTWGPCTEPTTTITKGTLEIHWTSGLNGTLTAGSTRTQFTVGTTIFGSCVFMLEPGVSFGTVTGTTSGDAVLHINAILHGTNLCPTTARWVGTYTITSPTPFAVTAG